MRLGIRRNLAQDRELALMTLRRELANHMVRHDPDRYIKLYRRACVVESGIKGMSKNDREKRFVKITEKIPYYADFDLIGVREHVLYADGFSMYSTDDLEDHY